MTSRILQDLSSVLAGRENAIIDQWWERTCAAPEITSASHLTREEFKDNIAAALKGLRDYLLGRELDDGMDRNIAEHGYNRWKQSFHLGELIRDWSHLQAVLIDEFSRFLADRGAADADRAEAFRRLAAFIAHSTTSSVEEYERLRQSQAASVFQDLRRLREREQLEVQQRSQALREYAHDMRGSLAALAGAGSVLSMAGIDPQQMENLADMIDSGVRAIAEMLETLLQLSRLEAGLEGIQLESVRVQQLGDELGKLLRPLADQQALELIIDGEQDLEVETDRAKLRRVLQNLLVNALKYTEQGSVSLRWKRLGGEPDRWCLIVEDTGPGLQGETGSAVAQAWNDPDLIQKPPQSVEAASETEGWTGEGIGLLIVRRLCEMLDIVVEMESETGVGTRFTLTVPINYTHRSGREAPNTP